MNYTIRSTISVNYNWKKFKISLTSLSKIPFQVIQPPFAQPQEENYILFRVAYSIFTWNYKNTFNICYLEIFFHGTIVFLMTTNIFILSTWKTFQQKKLISPHLSRLNTVTFPLFLCALSRTVIFSFFFHTLKYI